MSNTIDSSLTFIFITRTGTFVNVDAPGNASITGKIPADGVLIIEGMQPITVNSHHNYIASFWLGQNYPNPFSA